MSQSQEIKTLVDAHRKMERECGRAFKAMCEAKAAWQAAEKLRDEANQKMLTAMIAENVVKINAGDAMRCPHCMTEKFTITCGHSGGIPCCWACGGEIPAGFPDPAIWQYRDDAGGWRKVAP